MSHGIGSRARKRNTPSLINVGVFRNDFDWDGRASTLEDQLRGVFSPLGDMGIDLAEAVARLRDDPSYKGAFQRAFKRHADVDGLVSALSAFQRSLILGESRFDRFYLGSDSSALSESEKRGWTLFRSGRSGCAGCHVPAPDPGGSGLIVFRDNRFHNLGVGYNDGQMMDLGRFSVTRRSNDWGSFVIPSLRNVSLTAPYMHDGSLATLQEVVEFYSRGGVVNPNLDPVMRPRDFSEMEKADLVAFLEALTTDWLRDSVAVAAHFFNGRRRAIR